MLWRTSPAATELEERTLGWVGELIGLPDSAGSGRSPTPRRARRCTRWPRPARRRAWTSAAAGWPAATDLPPLRVYTSAEAHSSVEKACIALGLGQQGLRKIEADDAVPDAPRRAGGRSRGGRRGGRAADRGRADGRHDVDHQRRPGGRGRRDRARATACGCTSTRRTAARRGCVPAHRHLLDGCERADSLVFNPHKWLLTPVDCSLLYTARPEVLRQAFSVVPFYLTTRRRRRRRT